MGMGVYGGIVEGIYLVNQSLVEDKDNGAVVGWVNKCKSKCFL